MGTYRAYCFDGVGRVWIEDRMKAESDDEAILAAVAIPNAVKVELRDDGRLVTVVEKKVPGR